MVYTSINYMKSIAIVGAGLAGLRAALELSKNHKVTLYEKSPSVGGRIASRRFGTVVVNHGAPVFHGNELLISDPLFPEFSPKLNFSGAATDLPKVMRDKLLQSPNVSVFFNTRILSISDRAIVRTSEGPGIVFDAVILTAPLPQVRELIGHEVLPSVSYSKQVLFIGSENDSPVRLELPQEFSEMNFEDADSVLREKAEAFLSRPLASLDLKKWRYSRVISGHKENFYKLNSQVLIAGDAFDPHGKFHAGSAWLSGLMVARSFL